MKTNTNNSVALSLYGRKNSLKIFFISFFLFFSGLTHAVFAQAVTGVITDFNTYWKSSTTSLNSTKPNKSHNLLAFTYNNVQYSTGVNDALLLSRGDVFVPGDFWSLPVGSISGTPNSNTKVGLGQLYDGVNNGASNPPPQHGISMYLTDGVKGLNLGTCIANLPLGSMNFYVNNIRPESIGDGVPDIVVTQIADPSGNSFDRYEFVNTNGSRVGSYMDIVFTNITPVGTWTADFYEASSNPLVLTPSFTNTDRPVRLWAADLSDFGITLSNYQNIARFKINLCGNSDVAFVSYNNSSFGVTGILPVILGDFKAGNTGKAIQLDWNTQSEANTKHFIIERSNNGSDFIAVGNVPAAGNSNSVRRYSYTDYYPGTGNNYYRLKMVDNNDEVTYSRIIKIETNQSAITVRLYPNPASEYITLQHPIVDSKNSFVAVYNSQGMLMQKKVPASNSTQTRIEVQGLAKGIYFILWQRDNEKIMKQVVVN